MEGNGEKFVRVQINGVADNDRLSKVYFLDDDYRTPVEFGAFLQKETGALPLATRFFAQFKDYPIEARNSVGLPVSSHNVSGDGEIVYIMPLGEGSNWYWPPSASRVAIPDIATPSGAVVELETISTRPRVFQVHNLVADDECDQLIALAKGSNELGRSEVGFGGDDEEGDDEEGEEREKSISDVRTSENMFDNNWPLARAIKQRIGELIRIPYERSTHGMFDGLQVLRYNVSKAYDSHEDYFDAEDDEEMNFDTTTGGINRYLTVMLYLNDVEKGGETVFPLAPMDEERSKREGRVPATDEFLDSVGIKAGSWERDMVRQCEQKTVVYPRKGSALLFYSMDPFGIEDSLSNHGGCPVLVGQKWAANVWVWNKNAGFTEGVCDDNELLHFEIVNQMEGDRAVVEVLSFARTSCKGCREPAQTHVELEHGDSFGIFACPSDVYEGWILSEEDDSVGTLVFSSDHFRLDELQRGPVFTIVGENLFLGKDGETEIFVNGKRPPPASAAGNPPKLAALKNRKWQQHSGGLDFPTVYDAHEDMLAKEQAEATVVDLDEGLESFTVTQLDEKGEERAEL
jgi:hypothetical protein